MIVIGFIFIFGNKNENRKNDNKNDNKISSDLNIVPSDTYTIVNSLVGELKFKTASKTKFWNSNENFGAGEIDTVFLYSNTGDKPNDFEKVFNPNYDVSGIIFASSSSVSPKNPDTIEKKLNQGWGLTNHKLTKVNDKLFSYNLKAENESKYLEANYFEFDKNSYYSVQLEIVKSRFSKEEIEKIIDEYHLIIETMEYKSID